MSLTTNRVVAMLRLAFTSRDIAIQRSALEWLAAQLDERLNGHLTVIMNVGNLADLGTPLTAVSLHERLQGPMRKYIFLHEPQGMPTLVDLTDAGLLLLATCGDRKRSACAACLLFMRANPGDGVYDLAKELCQPV